MLNVLRFVMLGALVLTSIGYLDAQRTNEIDGGGFCHTTFEDLDCPNGATSTMCLFDQTFVGEWTLNCDVLDEHHPFPDLNDNCNTKVDGNGDDCGDQISLQSGIGPCAPVGCNPL